MDVIKLELNDQRYEDFEEIKKIPRKPAKVYRKDRLNEFSNGRKKKHSRYDLVIKGVDQHIDITYDPKL